jgi:hypothetical protein
MEKNLRDKVLPIANRVRKWAEIKAKKANKHPDDLCGWCAISSAHLFREMANEGLKPELHYVDKDWVSHCFVVVDDYVVDVTATQFTDFKNKKIVILHIKEAEQYVYYQTNNVFKTPSALRDFQLKSHWPKDQVCYTR